VFFLGTISSAASRLGLTLAACLVLHRASLADDADGRPTSIDLRTAVVVVPDDLDGPQAKSVALLVEEIAARTRLRLPVGHRWPMDSKTPVIVIGTANALGRFSDKFRTGLPDGSQRLPAEGFRIHVEMSVERAPVIVVAGNDSRGVLFGVGKLLRSLAMSRDRIEVRAPLSVTTAPVMPIRGHQLGFRPKTNSYDAWNLDQWEQYIRDLAVFGCNTIELIPPRSDDDADSPHFPLPPMEMMIGMSQLAADYGLDVWIWYPALDPRYVTGEAIDAAVREWGEVVSKLPRVNALFVPTGDPGEAPPQELMAMLARQAEQVQRIHPGAQIWISMQSFSQPEFHQMLTILEQEPKWLAGIGYGPQTRVSLARLREVLPRRYPIRGYPDITHSLRCQYPVPDWDLAYALTEGREVINPRPLDQTTIFQIYKDHTQGIITYSEGCNDDVNKMIWSALGWDPGTKPIEMLREYSRYFIGEKYTDDFAQSLLALERNWRGPLRSNESVLTTLQQLDTMEKTADPRTRRNWRFQQAQYRATYDAYQHCRSIAEAAQEVAAMNALAQAPQTGASTALQDAEAILDHPCDTAHGDALKARVKELAAALFQSIGMQLSVEKYGAIAVGRGANLDELDVPLNNRVWLKRRFAELRNLGSEDEKLRGIHEIVHWTDPGPGGFYDDLGNPSHQAHLVREESYAEDPGYLETPSIGFHTDIIWRR
jgi:hypothetical protein